MRCAAAATAVRDDLPAHACGCGALACTPLSQVVVMTHAYGDCGGVRYLTNGLKASERATAQRAAATHAKQTRRRQRQQAEQMQQRCSGSGINSRLTAAPRTHACVYCFACAACQPLPLCNARAAQCAQVYYLYRRSIHAQSTLPTFVGAFRLLRLICLRERVDLVHCHQAFSTLGGEALLQARTMGYKASAKGRARDSSKRGSLCRSCVHARMRARTAPSLTAASQSWLTPLSLSPIAVHAHQHTRPRARSNACTCPPSDGVHRPFPVWLCRRRQHRNQQAAQGHSGRRAGCHLRQPHQQGEHGAARLPAPGRGVSHSERCVAACTCAVCACTSAACEGLLAADGDCMCCACCDWPCCYCCCCCCSRGRKRV